MRTQAKDPSRASVCICFADPIRSDPLCLCLVRREGRRPKLRSKWWYNRRRLLPWGGPAHETRTRRGENLTYGSSREGEKIKLYTIHGLFRLSFFFNKKIIICTETILHFHPHASPEFCTCYVAFLSLHTKTTIQMAPPGNQSMILFHLFSLESKMSLREFNGGCVSCEHQRSQLSTLNRIE